VAASCLIAVAISGIFQNGGLSCGNLLIRCSFVVLLKLVSRLRMLDCIAGSVDITLTMNHAYQQTLDGITIDALIATLKVVQTELNS
jgi:hypothetical protein